MDSMPITVALPHFKNDMSIARAQMDVTGTMPPCKGLDEDLVTEMQMCYIEFLISNKRDLEAEQVIEEFIYDDERMQQLPELYAAWLWLARMTLLIDGGNASLSLGAAENALLVLSGHQGKKNEDFHAIVAALLYNLSLAHHDMGDNSRAAKELTKAQQILERLVKRNETRFSAMLLTSVKASTEVIKSKTKQMNVLAHYQSASAMPCPTWSTPWARKATSCSRWATAAMPSSITPRPCVIKRNWARRWGIANCSCPSGWPKRS